MAAVPLDRLLLETDCPWCEIRPSHAGKRCRRGRHSSICQGAHKLGGGSTAALREGLPTQCWGSARVQHLQL